MRVTILETQVKGGSKKSCKIAINMQTAVELEGHLEKSETIETFEPFYAEVDGSLMMAVTDYSPVSLSEDAYEESVRNGEIKFL